MLLDVVVATAVSVKPNITLNETLSELVNKNKINRSFVKIHSKGLTISMYQSSTIYAVRSPVVFVLRKCVFSGRFENENVGKMENIVFRFEN